MKKTIIVATDFTESSRNALAYTCGLVGSNQYRLLLVHVYTTPVTYTSDGVALTALKDAIDDAETRLAGEIRWAKRTYPYIDIQQADVLVGGLKEKLNEVIEDEKPEVIVMGASNNYSDLWKWDDELLDALTSLPIPFLLIPQHISFAPVKNIGFACDYRNLCTPRQVSFIQTVISNTKAQLHVVHVTRSKPESQDVREKNEVLLHDMMGETPSYYNIEDPNVIDAVTHFAQEHSLDFLIVIPHKHDIWYSVFHQSHTKQLARLNNLPILALHD